jgi:hypothetical protein
VQRRSEPRRVTPMRSTRFGGIRTGGARMLEVSVAGLILGLLASCTAEPPMVPTPPTDPPSPQLEPHFRNSMTVDPAIAEPGSVLTLGFPSNRQRGLGYGLEAVGANGWTIEYYLVAICKGDEEPGRRSWIRAGGGNGGSGFGWPDVSMGGPGGERIRVPDVATPGVYRLCTANAAQQSCALLTVISRCRLGAEGAPAAMSSGRVAGLF